MIDVNSFIQPVVPTRPPAVCISGVYVHILTAHTNDEQCPVAADTSFTNLPNNCVQILPFHHCLYWQLLVIAVSGQ